MEKIKDLTNQLSSTNQDNKKSLDKLKLEKEKLELALYKSLPQLKSKIYSLNDISKEIPEDAVLIEFQKYRPYIFIDPDQSMDETTWGDAKYQALILFPNNKVESVDLGKAAEIDQLISLGLVSSEQSLIDAQDIWHELGSKIIKPLEKYIKNKKTLFISPDSELNKVPFAAIGSFNKTDLLGDIFKLRLLTTGRELITLNKEKNLSNKKSKAEIISNKIIKPLTEGTVYDINIGDWKFINDWRNFCAESFYYQNLMGGCGNFQNNSVILANVEISINKNFLKNAENIFEKTKSSTFYLNTGAGFYATTSSPSKSNDLKIAINKKTDSKIYLFKDIKNELSNYKGSPERNSHPLFFSNPLQLKRSKVGSLRYGSPSISLLTSNEKEIFSYSCNVYDCPYSENIKFIPISNGVIPQFSLFGCVDIGNGCVSTIIPNAKYLIMLNFSTESLKAIKDIKVEYKKAS